jgi:uncharacterized protein with LGFP repeats
VSTLDDLNAGPGGMAGFIGALTRRLRPVSRRDVLVGATVAAAALATKPKEYALTPVAAYATICGPGNTAASGWTVFCATVNRGVNTCPPGSFAAGWWKAADSSWCGGGYRYIVDCNASCSKCTTGCSDNMCDSRCWSCSCGTGSTATCDQRRVCCNAFRYGQCNTQVKCSGGVHCRVVSCVAPYQWTSCTTTSLVDNRTSEHSAPSLPAWGPIEQRYIAMGAQASYLKASAGPIRVVGDGVGAYVTYQGGTIYHTAATGAVPVTASVNLVLVGKGGVLGPLGYPTAPYRVGLPNAGWIQLYQRGAIIDSGSTTTQAVSGDSYRVWVANGRETGLLGYPTGPQTQPTGRGWVQSFEHGAIADSNSTEPLVVGPTMIAAWNAAGGAAGVLGYPTTALLTAARGSHQSFRSGELWRLGSGPVRRVHGAVVTAWKKAGGSAGSYGYPVTDTVVDAGGRLTCTFEGGRITV